MARPKKPTVMEKIAEKVDHVLHPDHRSEPEMVQAASPAPVRAGDYEQHPKFAKFKKGAK